MHVSDNFLLQFQNEANRYIDIYHFGIEPMGFQTPLTLELLSKGIINPDCCKGKCTVLIPVFLGCICCWVLSYVVAFNHIGECCESIPWNHTGSYVLSL